MEYDKALKHLQQRMKELGYNTDTQIAAFGGR
jgi:phosphoglycerol transferase MdoB-like AlkP superfamily enzyme